MNIKYFDLVKNNFEFTYRKPLKEIVYDGLRKSIINGDLPINERINELEYAENLNISRTPIRVALKRLEKEDLVEYIPNYGVVVKRITKEDIEEIYSIRKALEYLSLEAAMNNMTVENFKEMDLLLKQTEIAINYKDVDNIVSLFREYDNRMTIFGNKIRVEQILFQLREYLERFRKVSLSDDVRRKEAFLEHVMILDAMREKDSEGLRKLNDEHLSSSQKFVSNQIEEYSREK